MPNVTITNLQAVDDFLPSLYKTFTPGEAITLFRDQTDLDGMADLKNRVAAGQFSATTVYTAQELLAAIGKLSCAPASAVLPTQAVQRGEATGIPIGVPGPVVVPVVFPTAYKAATEPDVALAVDYTAAAGGTLTDVGITAITNTGFNIVLTVVLPGAAVDVEWLAVGETA